MTLGLENIALTPEDNILIYGIGNIGRQDDGLGIRLIGKLESAGLAGRVTFESNYQLSIEDALLISKFDVVVFADAARDGSSAAPFSVRDIEPTSEFAFTTHAMGAPSVLSLCEDLYGRTPRTFLLAMPGYEWDIAENLSPQATQNLDRTYVCLAAALTGVRCTKSL